MSVMYSGGKTSAMNCLSTAVHAADLELDLITTVLPPAMAAATTPKVSRKGKLNGLITNDTPYGILYTLVNMLGKHISPLRCHSGRAHRRRPWMISLISTMMGPMSHRYASTALRPRSAAKACSNSD